MGIDAGIALSGRPTVQLMTPTEIMNMKRLAQQNQAVDQEMEQKRTMSDIMKRNTMTGPDGKVSMNRGGALSEMYKANPQAAMEWEKKLQTEDLDTLKNHTEAAKTLIWNATPESWTASRQKGIEMGLPNFDKLPESYDPATHDRLKYATQTGAEQVAEQWKRKNFEQGEREMLSRSLDRKEARDERRFQAGVKVDEKMQGLKTPYGLANSTDDAKQLKDAHESKLNFDNKLDQMIALRTSKNGGEVLDRDAVQRGKQLSKDLLLEYKNMAKLGVLSKSDEDIINAIIPEDPLAFNSPLAAIQGQDPILTRLKGFKADSDKDFKTRISTRTRSGIEQSLSGKGEPSAATVRMTDGKGGIFDIPQSQVGEAISSGLKKGG